MKLLIDSREPEKWKRRVAEIGKKLGFDTEVKALPVGDYETDKAIVERKEIMDLISSVYDKRLVQQFSKLSETDKIPILLVVGSMKEVFALKNALQLNVDPHLVYGAVSSAVVRSGTMLLWIHNENDAMWTFLKILKKIEEDKWQIPKGANPRTMLSKALKLKREQLDEIFARYGSITHLTKKDLMKIKGIGEKKADYCLKVLRGDFNDL
ncbi:MAG: ERCC4 domain-containing protein [Candidatus Thorarchaeota archaeon]